MVTLPQRQIDRFLAHHGLASSFARLATEHYLPIAEWLSTQCMQRPPALVGINGAQGTGKTTFAAFLALALRAAGHRVAVLSLDDFYLTAAERKQLGARQHPLLRVRGVPGTYDLALLTDVLEHSGRLSAGESLRVPSFDKATDDRAETGRWRILQGPLELILLEGWCIGCRPQPASALAEPVNALERAHDADGRWRQFVNQQLAGPYAQLFARLESMIFLQAPSFDAVLRWRQEQEQKLASALPFVNRRAMSAVDIEQFVQHFERVTLANQAGLAATADIVLELDEQHGCARRHCNR